MGRIAPMPEEFPVTIQLRELNDEDLLDFWEESQFLERLLEDENINEGGVTPNYERLILHELQLRSCRRLRAKRA
ncbi:MAG: hypothetical protein R3Y11_02090 [Pseudomonadota bacterium]